MKLLMHRRLVCLFSGANAWKMRLQRSRALLRSQQRSSCARCLRCLTSGCIITVARILRISQRKLQLGWLRLAPCMYSLICHLWIVRCAHRILHALLPLAYHNAHAYSLQDDGGRLIAHRTLFRVALDVDLRTVDVRALLSPCSVTELCCIPDCVRDGRFVLQLHVSACKCMWHCCASCSAHSIVLPAHRVGCTDRTRCSPEQALAVPCC